MKRIFLSLICSLPLMAWSQSVWERPETAVQTETVKEKVHKEKKTVKDTADIKYMAGTVPLNKEGKVEWVLDVDVPGKSATQIYDMMLKCLMDLTKTENQLEGSDVTLVNKQDHIVVASVKEWLVFKENFLMLDRTKFYYTLVAYCSDNHLKLSMSRIYYRYEEEQNDGGRVYKAEEWITDDNALNRKKTRLLPLSAKFRRKTIDRKDQIFDTIEKMVLK